MLPERRIIHQHIELWKVRFHARREGCDLHRVRDIALDGVELRVLRLHLIEHRLAPTSDDDFIAEFEELEGESKADTGGASGDKDRATSEFHKSPFVTA